MFTNAVVRFSVLLLDGFLGLTSVAGGLGILLGWIPLAPESLLGSPFANYVIPGVVLLVIVGGSGLLAAFAILRRHEIGALASVFAGLMIMSYEAVEIAVIGFHWLQALYFAVGVVIVLLSWQRASTTVRTIALMGMEQPSFIEATRY